MKKNYVVLFTVLALFSSSLFAGPFSNLANSINALTDNGEVDVVALPLVEGRSILPAIYKFTHEDRVVDGKKILKEEVSLTSINAYDNSYEVKYSLTYKFGLFTQKQDSKVIINSDEKNIYVSTLSLVNYSVDRRGRATGDSAKMNRSSCRTNSENIINEVMYILTNFSDEEYELYKEKAIYDLDFYSSINEHCPNTLKAKKWHKENDGIDKLFTIPLMTVAKVDLSDKDGFEYKISGCYLVPSNDSSLKSINITFYTNNDKYIEMNEGDNISFRGIAKKLTFDDTLFINGPYALRNICLEDIE